MPEGIQVTIETTRPAAPPVSKTTDKRIPALDGLRAISILFVLFNHLVGTRYFSARLTPLGQFGNFGVRIFFVISGFLITTLLLREYERTGSISLTNFYLRRVLRIAPAAYAYLFVLAVLNVRYGILLRHDLLFAATYLTNFHPIRSWYVGHLWSLAVEEQFYLLWPAVLAFWGVRPARRVAVVTILLVPILRVAWWFAFPTMPMQTRIGEMFFTVADAIACGCLLAIQRRWLWRQRWYGALMESRWFFLVPVAATEFRFTYRHAIPHFLISLPLMNLGIALTMDWRMSHARSAVGKFLDWKPMVFLGTLSYSLYLWQMPFLNQFSRAPWAAFPVNLCLALLAALTSYKIVEQPFLKLKETIQLKRIGLAGRVDESSIHIPERCSASSHVQP
jgi:peptidoglycan/LPS O-acetylase OafA/YrhL